MVDDGTAQVCTKLLQHVQWPRYSVCLVDRIVGIPDPRVPVVVESVAMPGIGSGFRHRIDETRSCSSVCGVVRIIRHLKFLNRLLSENVWHARSPACFTKVIARGVRAVDGEGIRTISVCIAGIRSALLARHAH